MSTATSLRAAVDEIILGPDWNGAAMTPHEYDAVEDCDELYVYELVNGVVIVSPPPLEAERDPNEDLGYMLRRYQEEHPKGKCLDATLPEQAVYCGRNRRRADRVIWIGLGRQPNPRRDAPKIAIEFVSAGKRARRRDYQEKRREYRAFGVAEYWIIDRFERVMTVYRADGTESVVSEGQTYRTPLLPGFKLDLARLFSRADRWSE